MDPDIAEELETVKGVLRALVASSPIRMTVRMLIADLVKMDEEVDYAKFGFPDLLSFLLSIPDALQLSERSYNAVITPVVPDRSRHITRMISKQAIKKTRYTVNSPRNMFISERSVSAVNASQSPRNPGARPTPSVPSAAQENVRIATDVRNDEQLLPVVANGAIRKAVQQTPRDVATVTQSRPSRANRDDIMAVDDDNARSPSAMSSASVPTAVQANIRQLLAMHPHGISVLRLQATYERRFHTRLNYSSYGYGTLLQMCLDVPHIMHYHQTQFNGGIVYANAQAAQNDEREPAQQIPRALPQLIQSPTSSNADDDRNARNSGATNLPEMIPSRPFLNPHEFMNVGDITRATIFAENEEPVAIVISEVYDLSKFWFRLHSKALYDFYKCLNVHYNAYIQELEIPPEYIVEGIACVVRVANGFERARVIKRDHGRGVKVFCVDTGAVLTAGAWDIFVLETFFAKMRRQAMRGRLAEVMPPIWGQQWSKKASDLFGQYAKGKQFLADVVRTEIQRANDYIIFELKIWEQDRCVHDLFIALKYAIHCTETQTVLERYDFAPFPNHHLYPTFKQLESGDAPTTPEICELQCANVQLQIAPFGNEVNHHCSRSMHDNEQSTSTSGPNSSLREANNESQHSHIPINGPMSRMWNPIFPGNRIEDMRMHPASVQRSMIRIANYIQVIPFMGKSVHLVRIMSATYVFLSEIYRVFGITTDTDIIRLKLMRIRIDVRSLPLNELSADFRYHLLYARLIMPTENDIKFTCQTNLEAMLQVMQSSMDVHENNASDSSEESS